MGDYLIQYKTNSSEDTAIDFYYNKDSKNFNNVKAFVVLGQYSYKYSSGLEKNIYTYTNKVYNPELVYKLEINVWNLLYERDNIDHLHYKALLNADFYGYYNETFKGKKVSLNYYFTLPLESAREMIIHKCKGDICNVNNPKSWTTDPRIVVCKINKDNHVNEIINEIDIFINTGDFGVHRTSAFSPNDISIVFLLTRR